MAEIPDYWHAVRVAVRGDRRHVVYGAGAEVDVGEQDQRGATVDRVGEALRLGEDEVELPIEEIDQPFQDVDVGGEVAVLGDDATAPRTPTKQRGCELEQVDGGGIGDDDFALGRADQRRDGIAGLTGEKEPVGIEPAFDEAAAPFLPDGAV